MRANTDYRSVVISRSSDLDLGQNTRVTKHRSKILAKKVVINVGQKKWRVQIILKVGSGFLSNEAGSANTNTKYSFNLTQQNESTVEPRRNTSVYSMITNIIFISVYPRSLAPFYIVSKIGQIYWT